MKTEYESLEELDAAFEDEMERQEYISALQNKIEDQGELVESIYEDWLNAKDYLEELEAELLELQNE
jgi:hypothetical protein